MHLMFKWAANLNVKVHYLQDKYICVVLSKQPKFFNSSYNEQLKCPDLGSDWADAHTDLNLPWRAGDHAGHVLP